MDTPESPPELSQEDLAGILLFCEIAQIHGSYVTLKEVALLTGTSLSEEEFEHAWQNNTLLQQKFATTSGLIVPRKADDSGSISDILSLETEKRKQTEEKLLRAKNFAAFSRSDSIKHLSVSGSASYGSMLKNDDIDFFVITSRCAAWIYIFRTLLLARIYRLLHQDSPTLCLSCVMDEDYATKRFESERDALFARDALNVESIFGSDYYQRLLGRADWIAQLFPQLYYLRVNGKSPDGRMREKAGETSFLAKSANLLLYLTLGRYLDLKSYLLNRRYMKKRLYRSLFVTIKSADHCIYESAHYAALRRKYREFRPFATG